MAGFQTFQNFQQQPNPILFITVQGEQAVNNYLVGAGNTVVMADFNAGMMWIKSTSANSIPQPVRKFRLEEIIEQPQTQADGVSRAEFDELKKMIAGLAASMQPAEPKKEAKK